MIRDILLANKEDDLKQLAKDISKNIDADVLQAEIALKDIQDVITDLKDTLTAHEELACLGATQIGVKKRIFVARNDDGKTIDAYIDPKIIKVYPNKIKLFRESCASLPEGSYITRRYSMIKVNYYDEAGNYHKTILRNTDAAMFQHEVDHFYGILVNGIAEN